MAPPSVYGVRVPQRPSLGAAYGQSSAPGAADLSRHCSALEQKRWNLAHV